MYNEMITLAGKEYMDPKKNIKAIKYMLDNGQEFVYLNYKYRHAEKIY
jgi:hypothetical protein